MKKTLTGIYFVALLLCMVNISFADLGPKPSLEIVVKNPPKNFYYLDLLVDYRSEYDNYFFAEDRIENKEIFEILKNFDLEGWRPVMAAGIGAPIMGSLTGTPNGEDMRHYFSYLGVPGKFRVIIITEDKEIILSKNILERKSFNTKATYDLETGIIKERPLLLSQLLSLLYTLPITLLIEGLILLLFRFKLKENWKAFVIINLITQIGLTVGVSFAMLGMGLIGAVLIYLLIEILILIAEPILFSIFLKGHSKLRRVLYAITANIASFAIGIFITIISSL